MRVRTIQLISMMIAALLFSASISLAQGGDPVTKDEIRKKLVPLVGSSNQGTQFYMTFHPCWEETGANNQLRVYVSSAVETNVTLTIPGRGYVESKKTLPNDIIEFVLPPELGQMYSKDDREPPLPEQLWEGRAVVVESEAPIIAYGVTRYRYTSDGYLALPSHVLGKEYIAACYTDPTGDTGVQWLTPYTSIVAVYDDTDVKIIYGGNASSTTSGGQAMYSEDDITMNTADVFLAGALGAKCDLTGTRIIANKPIAVISGCFCAYIPSNVSACDFIIEQDLPMEAWGTKYHYSPITERENNSLIRVFAKRRNTFFYRDGVRIGLIERVGGITEDGGWIELRAASGAPKPATFTAESPINVVQYNPGQSDDGVPSDPFQLALSPIEQYQDEILFNTPGIRDGVGFKDNFINIVYKESAAGGIPDGFEYGRVVNGQLRWVKLRDAYPGAGMQYPADPDITDGRQFRAKTVKLPNDGVYALRNTEPFVSYAYGFDQWDSYGFPTSVALADLAKPDTIPPIAEFTKDCDGNIEGGLIIDEPRNVPQFRSNLGIIYLDGDNSYNYSYEIDEFIPGDDREVEFSLTVLNPAFPACATIVMVDRAGNTSDTTICHDPPQFNVRLRDGELGDVANFGQLKADAEPVTLPFVVESLEDEFPVEVTRIGLYSEDEEKEPGNAGFGPGFTVSGIDVPFTLAPGEIREFAVTFDPALIGDERRVFFDSLGVADTCVSFYTQRIVASVGDPQISVADHNFGAVTVGERTNWEPIQVTNSGAKELVISGWTVDNPDLVSDINDQENTVFETRNDLYAINNTPRIINPGDTETLFEVSYTPDAVEDHNITIYFENDADDIDDPNSVIIGRGIQPGLATAGFDWGARSANIGTYKQDYDAALHGEFAYPQNGYLADGVDQFDNQPLTLFNTGSQEVNITSVDIVSTSPNLPENAFLIEINGELLPMNNAGNLSRLNNTSIDDGDQITYNVYFNPEQAGEYEITLRFNSDAGNEPPTATFTGIGLVPRVENDNFDFTAEFGDVIIGTGAVELVRQVRNIDWEFADVLIINGFDVDPAGAISDMNGIGGQYFRWNDVRIVRNDGVEFDINSQNIELAPGQYIDITGEFEPDEANVFNATMRLTSNAELDAQPEWDGSSQGVDFGLTGVDARICRNDNTTILVPVESFATTAINIDDIRLVDAQGNEPDDLAIITEFPFPLQAGEIANIELAYAPTGEYNVQNYTLEATSTTYGDPITRSANVGVESIFETYTSQSEITGVDDKDGDQWVVESGQTFQYTIPLITNDMDLSTATEFTLDISYSADFLELNTETIEVGSQYLRDRGYNVADGDISSRIENNIVTTTVVVRGNQPITNADPYNFINMSFNVFEPKYGLGESDRKNEESDIEHQFRFNDVCMEVIETGTSVQLAPICAENLRQIVFTNSQFQLNDVNPNPVQSVGGTIGFSVGLEADTRLELIDAAGNVRTLISQRLTPGEYQVDIPIDKLSSGTYIYRLDCGTFVETKKLVIAK